MKQFLTLLAITSGLLACQDESVDKERHFPLPCQLISMRSENYVQYDNFGDTKKKYIHYRDFTYKNGALATFAPYTTITDSATQESIYLNAAKDEFVLHHFQNLNMTKVDLIRTGDYGQTHGVEDVFNIHWQNGRIQTIVESFDRHGYTGDIEEKKLFYQNDNLISVEIWSSLRRDTLQFVETIYFDFEDDNLTSYKIIPDSDLEETEVDFQYDENLNPLFGNLLYFLWSGRYDLYFSKNNPITTSDEFFGQTIQYSYDSLGLPTTSQYEGAIYPFGIGTVNFEYFYNCSE